MRIEENIAGNLVRRGECFLFIQELEVKLKHVIKVTNFYC